MAYMPLIIAHRGHTVDAPEQTIAAYVRAIELGAKMIEADVQLTRDGVAIMLHDARLDRTTSGHGPAGALDWRDLSQLDAGSWFDPAFSGERIPRLDELFALAERHSIALCLEAKGDTHAANTEVALVIAHEIARRDRLEIDALASFDHAALHRALAEVPGLRIAPDRLPERGPSSAVELLAQAHAIGARIIQHHFADLTRAVVAEVEAEGIEIWAWPPTTFDEIAFTLATRPAAIMGDDVRAMVSAVDALTVSG